MTRKMKDSGIQWVGEIPEDWKISKVKYIGQYINGYAFKPDDWSSLGKPIIRIQDLTGSNSSPNFYDGILSDKYLVKNGDILISWAATLDAFTWQKEEGWLNQHIFKAIPNYESVIKRFFFYLVKVAMENMNHDNKHGIVMQHVTLDIFNKFSVPIPSISEQQKIADFLDKKYAEIDALSLDIQSQIDILEDYKKSVITEAVTKGLNPDVEMKDGGIEWISTAPTHWYSSKIKYEIFPLQRPVRSDDLVMTCFRDGEVTLRQNRREDGFTISFTENGYQGVETGDLVIHGMDTFAGAIGCSDSRGKITPVVHVCKTTGNNRFFMYMLRSMAINDVLMNYAEGIRIRSSDFRNFNKLGKFPIVVPPTSEQDEIVLYLDKKCEEIDAIIAQKEEQLLVIADYKKSLVYEYVTGKKEVL